MRPPIALPDGDQYKAIATHGPERLKAILDVTGNNCDSPVIVAKKPLEDYVGCLQDIVDATTIDLEKSHIQMSDIVETAKEYVFALVSWSQSHGAYACHCLESIPHKRTLVRIVKPS